MDTTDPTTGLNLVASSTSEAPAKWAPVPDTTPEPEYNFDAWTDEAEQAAIDEAAKAADIRYIIVEGRHFVARFPDGGIVKVPMHVSLADIRNLGAQSELDQIIALVELFGTEQEREILSRQNLPSVMRFASRFFDVFARIAGASLGESKG